MCNILIDYYRFYYADQRTPAGGFVTFDQLSGSAAAEFYFQLSEGDADIPWYATFVNGKGYTEFLDSTRR